MLFKDRDWQTWCKAAGIRAVKTFFQCVVSLIPASAMITDVNWQVILGTAALAAVASIATSLAGLPEIDMKEGEDA